MRVKSESEVAQSCPTLSGPMDCSLPGSSIHGISQAGVLEWGAIAFSVFPMLGIFKTIIACIRTTNIVIYFLSLLVYEITKEKGKRSAIS